MITIKPNSIYINGRFLTQKMTGVQRFAFEITKNLVEEKGDEIVILKPKGAIQDCYSTDRWRIVEVGCFSGFLWEQISLLIYLFFNTNKATLINLCNSAPLAYDKTIVAIHDMSYFVNPRWFSWSFHLAYKFIIPYIAANAKKIITVSEFSKSQISGFLKIDPQKIHVLYNGSEHLKEPLIGRLNKETYFLIVGSIDPRKNMQIALEVFRENIFHGAKLKIAGSPGNIFKSDSSLSLPDNIELLGRVSDVELADLYSNATGFIQCSLYEGFGIPILEAVKHGCPVIASDIPVFRELFENSCLFFDPTSSKSLKGVIQKALQNPELLESLKVNYNEILSKYSWKKSATELLKIAGNVQRN